MTNQIKASNPVCAQLRGILIGKMATLPENAIYQADMLAWLSRAALDVIGLAGAAISVSVIHLDI